MRKIANFRKCVPAALAALAAFVLCVPAFAAEVSDVSALLRAKQYGAALAQADEQLARRANDPHMRFIKGLALAGLARRDEAIAHFTSLAGDFPGMPEIHNNLAVLHAAGGRHDQARLALEAAVKANPSYARGHENLADMYLGLAMQSYAALLKLEPHNAEVRTRQALLLSARDEHSRK